MNTLIDLENISSVDRDIIDAILQNPQLFETQIRQRWTRLQERRLRDELAIRDGQGEEFEWFEGEMLSPEWRALLNREDLQLQHLAELVMEDQDQANDAAAADDRAAPAENNAAEDHPAPAENEEEAAARMEPEQEAAFPMEDPAEENNAPMIEPLTGPFHVVNGAAELHDQARYEAEDPESRVYYSHRVRLEPGEAQLVGSAFDNGAVRVETMRFPPEGISVQLPATINGREVSAALTRVNGVRVVVINGIVLWATPNTDDFSCQIFMDKDERAFRYYDYHNRINFDLI
ncbi:Oidioi.mRNA.OKI2018_I69.YSR.g17155.t1.cds [Oikopleura dioica]|uniref:Oidioi.mRNA.OKI2018_I69.YSR.g17155.t1.cds n=1 Tax=Oikopleura dioica TaxID=34765 RepID=A0ABN7SPM5_OIKDI|nr:Oidioi.mRNA.OKI2018_I69.YSR.g17155.t1.cds [Oikopleura dioica]